VIYAWKDVMDFLSAMLVNVIYMAQLVLLVTMMENVNVSPMFKEINAMNVKMDIMIILIVWNVVAMIKELWWIPFVIRKQDNVSVWKATLEKTVTNVHLDTKKHTMPMAI